LWVIAVVAGLMGLITLTLCVPLDTVFHLEIPERPRFRLRLVWLFGLISQELRRAKKEPEEKKPAEERPKKKRAANFRLILKILRTRGLPGKTANLVRDVLRQFKIKELSVNCRLLLDDPADAGLVFAVAGATAPLLNLPPKCQFSVEPAFSDEIAFEGHLHGVVSLKPIRLVWPLLRFILSLAMLRVIKTLVMSRWKRKKK